MTKEKNTFLIMVVAIVVILVVLLIVLALVKKEERVSREIEEVGNIAEEIYGFSAEIKEIKDKTLILEARILLADPSEEPIKQTVKALVVDETKIVKLKFPTEIPEDSDEPVFPEETELSFSDLKVGEKIDVGTLNNISENIKNKTEFPLGYIFIIEK